MEELKHMERAMEQGQALCPQDQALRAKGDPFAPKYLLRAGRNLPEAGTGGLGLLVIAGTWRSSKRVFAFPHKHTHHCLLIYMTNALCVPFVCTVI